MPVLLGQARRCCLLLAVSFGLVSGLGLLGCEGPPARSKPWRHQRLTPPAEPAVQGDGGLSSSEPERRIHSDTLRIHMNAAPSHLNPLVAPSVWTLRITRDTLFESLIRYEHPAGVPAPGAGHYAPGLASSWKISPSGREIKLQLHSGARFHDGEPVTAADVRFSLEAARSRKLTERPDDYPRVLLKDVVAVDIVNSRTVRIVLARPNGYVLRALAELPILPAHVYAKKMSARRGPVVGSGPFRFASWRDGVIRLERDPKYWGEPVHLQAVEFVYDSDAARALTAAKRGELDIIPELIASHYPAQATAPAVVANFVELRLRPPGLQLLAVNNATPPLDDLRVRRAMALLIDRSAIAKKHYGGLARAVSGPVWPGGPVDGPAPAELPFDPAAAARLLDEAGWTDADGDGLRERDGQRLQVVVLALPGDDSPDRELVVQSLRRSGFFVELRRGPESVLRNRVRDGDFHLALVHWVALVDSELSGALLSPPAPVRTRAGAATPAGTVGARGNLAPVAALLERLRGARSPAERAPLAVELGAELTAALPFIPLVAPDPYGLISKRVRGWSVWNGWIDLRSVSLVQD